MTDAPLRLFITADAAGGIWQYATDLASGLSRHGVSTVIAVLGAPPTPDQRLAAAAVPGLLVLESGLALDWTASSPAELERAALSLAALARAHRADLVHLNAPALAAFAAFPAPVVAVHHSCVATWWSAVRGPEPLPDDFRWRTDLVAQGLALAGATIAPTAAFAAAVARTYALAEPPRVVRNGRAAQPSPSAGPPEDFAFTAGRLWDEGKNVAALDRAAGRIAIPVLAAGPLSGPNGARASFPQLRCLGQLGDRAVAAHLARRPIYVSTALYEPFGLAVLEAAQAGSALVLSDIATFRELWDGAALFVPPADEHAIAAAVTALAADPGRRATLGRAARERAARYGLDAIVDGTLAVYRSLLPARASHPEEVTA